MDFNKLYGCCAAKKVNEWEVLKTFAEIILICPSQKFVT